MHVGFAEDDGSCLLERRDHRSVALRHKLPEDFRATRRANACRVNVVLERNGNPVKRSAIAPLRAARPAAEFALGLPGLADGLFFRNREIGVQPGIEFSDALEQQARELDRRKLALAEKLADLGNGSKSELRVSWLQKILS
jgi:hypothetical protein